MGADGRKRRDARRKDKQANKSTKKADRREARQGRIDSRKQGAVARADAKKAKVEAKYSPEAIKARAESRSNTLGMIGDLGGQLVSSLTGGTADAPYDEFNDAPYDEPQLPAVASDAPVPLWQQPIVLVGGAVVTLLGLALAFMR